MIQFDLHIFFSDGLVKNHQLASQLCKGLFHKPLDIRIPKFTKLRHFMVANHCSTWGVRKSFLQNKYPAKVMGWNLRGGIVHLIRSPKNVKDTNISLSINKALLEGGMMVSVHETPWVSEFGGSHGFPRGWTPGSTRYLGTSWHSFTDRKGSKLAAFTFEVQLPPSGEGLHDVGQAMFFFGQFRLPNKKTFHGTGWVYLDLA